MQHNPSQPPEGEDAMVQRAVLGLVMAQYPEPLTIPEIAHNFEPGEAERAIRDLVSAGLLECSGLSVRLSPPLAHFQRLELP